MNDVISFDVIKMAYHLGIRFDQKPHIENNAIVFDHDCNSFAIINDFIKEYMFQYNVQLEHFEEKDYQGDEFFHIFFGNPDIDQQYVVEFKISNKSDSMMIFWDTRLIP